MQMGTERNSNKHFARFLSTCPVHTIVIYGDSPLPETAFLSTFFEQLGGRSKLLSESFGLWLFSAQNNLHAKETFWRGQILLLCSPTFLKFHGPEVKLIDCFISLWTSLLVLITDQFSYLLQEVEMQVGSQS